MTRLERSPIVVEYEESYIKAFIGMMSVVFKRARAALTVALALALAVPAATFGKVLPGDLVGDAPVSSSAALTSAAPDVSMRSGMLIAEDGRVLWSREPDARRAIASVTKVMTAMVVLDRLALTDTLTVTAQATSIGESDAELRMGEKLTVREALSALLVKSGNDAALALAVRAAGSEKKFVALMNAKAAELGMTGTRFANSHGLDEPGHYSTAADVAVMSRVAMAKPDFRDIVRRKQVRIGRGGAARTLESSNLLLDTFAGATGVKTGWTSDAGYCLVASAQRGGVGLLAVVLGAESEAARFRQATRLLEWGFEHYRPVRIATEESVAGTVTVTDYLDRHVYALVSRDETATLFDLDGKVAERVLLSRRVRAPVARDQQLGTIRVTQGGRMISNVPLISDRAVPAPGFFERIGIAIERLWRRLFG